MSICMNISRQRSRCNSRSLVLTWTLYVALFLSLSSLSALADEGMWTLDNLPVKLLQEKYGFTITKEWLSHVQRSAVRFNDGGSGSFISGNGLVLTNHHVASGQLQKLSTEKRDLLKEGFHAKNLNEELPCADLELNVLMEIENVTPRINALLKAGMSPQEESSVVSAEIERIQQEASAKTGLRADVVNLYRGGEYWLYLYKKYTDVRLVFAPEKGIAYFGGDNDNFTFPRWNLDFTLFRVYENNKPVEPKHFLKWKTKGADLNELVFVAGHPGSTNRLNTYAQFEFNRDFAYPWRLRYLQTLIDIERKYGAQSPEKLRRVNDRIFGFENSKKASEGEFSALKTKAIADKVKANEDDIRSKLVNAEWQQQFGDAWSIIEKSNEAEKAMLKETAINAPIQVLQMARMLATFGTEMSKPEAQRNNGIMEQLKFGILSPAPIYQDHEEFFMAEFLAFIQQELGTDHPFVKAALDGGTPQSVAKATAGSSRLHDIEYRKTLINGDSQAILSSPDPMFAFLVRISPAVGQINAKRGREVNAPRTAALAKIAKARFAVYGKNSYPDATFTLRLSYGTVQGYPMNGTVAPHKTTLYGLYDRAESFNFVGDYDIPQRWKTMKSSINLATPVNFVSTNDIIGGNSGSPVINKDMEVVGLIFDGNIESLAGRFVYESTANRAVSVHPAFIIEALRSVYKAGSIADEIEGTKRK
jgi:hypothetical protein